MDAWTVTELMDAQQRGDSPYLEFLRVPALSGGLYVLRAGEPDRQQPHTEDEVYCVVAGRAVIEVAGEQRPIEPGSIVFVAAGVEHRFHTITEDLAVLVFFGPAEYTRSSQ